MDGREIGSEFSVFYNTFVVGGRKNKTVGSRMNALILNQVLGSSLLALRDGYLLLLEALGWCLSNSFQSFCDVKWMNIHISICQFSRGTFSARDINIDKQRAHQYTLH